METELPPRDDLEDLLERPEAAGQAQKCIRVVGHQRLALVHRTDHVQRRKARVRDLARRETLGNDADHFAPGGERGVGDRAHATHASTSVHEADPAFGEHRADVACRANVRRIEPVARTAKHADTH